MTLMYPERLKTAALTTMRIEEFCSVADAAEFIDLLCAEYPSKFPDSTLSEAEVRSWRNSLPALADLLRRQVPQPQGHILIEYPMPVGSLRADCILIAENENGPQIVVVELKQWTRGSVTLKNELGVSWLFVSASPPYTTIHPCEQANVYRTALEHTLDFGPLSPSFSSMALLHNYVEALEGELLRSEIYGSHLENCLLVSKSHGKGGLDALLSQLKRPSQAISFFNEPQLKYSDSFILNFSDKLNCSALFKATKGQTAAFRKIAATVRNAEAKTCVIVKGLVGTGKTVLAMKLVQYLMQLGKNPKYYVKSAAIGQCIKDLAFASDGRAETAFLVVDEAHRLTKEKAAGLMRNKDLVVFFIDDCQWISPTETCRSRDLLDAAHARGFEVITHVLDEQLRCGGANLYVQWVHDLVIGGQLKTYTSASTFPVEVVSSLQAMEDLLTEQADRGRNTTCRMVAGYCWHWQTESTPGAGYDIHIDGWRGRWNERMAFKAWNSVLGFNEEVGAIYTVQGFEYDYVGIIIGPDLVLKGDRIEVEYEHNADKWVRNVRNDPTLRDEAIRNIYYVLMTRAKKGVFLYAVDEPLRKFLQTSVGRSRPHLLG